MALIDNINFPQDIKKLSPEQFKELACDIRSFLIENVSKTGGHLASNLGVVELTIALHRVFNMPEDKIIWDVGHQTYVHKILTGRKNRFNTLRKYDGMSGFPKPSESEYDIFVAGHSSTSISAALGIASARDIKKEKYNVVAVIGDGALTGGMAFEALNDAGNSNKNMMVILNDNEMSISRNVGGLSSYLGKIRTEPAYINLRDDIENLVKKIPAIGNNLFKSTEKLKDGLKFLIIQGMLFEELGFTYLGPIDGHNIENMIRVLQRAKNIKGPILIHVVTKKGKGYHYAEKNPHIFHGIDPFEVETGKKINISKPSYSSVFGEEIVNEGKTNSKIVAITAAMRDGTGLQGFSQEFPDRFFDVGIAEQHAVTFAAGLASSGLKPIFAVYSTFLQRAYDQVVHDVCIQNLPVVLAIDRAGIIGEDGETHQGVLDLSFLRSIPNMTIVAPKDITEFRMLLKWCFNYSGGPVAIRYPRGGDLDYEFSSYSDIVKGKWEVIHKGTHAAVLAVGKMVQVAAMAAERLRKKGIDITVLNCRYIKPLDNNLINETIRNHNVIITLEDNYISGGFGSGVLEHLASQGFKNKFISLGYPNEFITHGSTEILYKKYGLDVDGVTDSILMHL